MVAHNFNPSILEAEADNLCKLEARLVYSEFQASKGFISETLSQKKLTWNTLLILV